MVHGPALHGTFISWSDDARYGLRLSGDGGHCEQRSESENARRRLKCSANKGHVCLFSITMKCVVRRAVAQPRAAVRESAVPAV